MFDGKQVYEKIYIHIFNIYFIKGLVQCKIFLSRMTVFEEKTGERRMGMNGSYSVAVLIFCLGVFMTACTVFYILHGNKKYKDRDPFDEED